MKLIIWQVINTSIFTKTAPLLPLLLAVDHEIWVLLAGAQVGCDYLLLNRLTFRDKGLTVE